MKKFTQKIITILIVSIVCNFNVFAVNTVDFFYNTKVVNYSVVITWDKEAPDVVLYSPSGIAIDVFSNKDTFTSETFAIYNLIETELGQWQISCDKKGNEYVDITYTEQHDGLWIDEFEITELLENSANVYFKVDKELNYTYEISAILDDDTSAKKILKTGSSNSLVVETSVNLSELNSYHGYKLLLTVSLSDTELLIQDTAVSEPFDYSNANEADAPLIENVDITINLENNIVTINTSEHFKNTEMLLRYETDVLAEKTDIFTQSTSFAYDFESTKLFLGLRFEDRGKYSQELVRLLDFDSCVSFDWADKDAHAINTSTTTVYINNAEDFEACVTINGVSNYTTMQSNILNIGLIDGYNEIEIMVTDADGIKWVFGSDIFVDVSSPSFRVYEDYNNKIVYEDSIIVVGEVELGSSLTLNGETVEVDLAGGFVVEVPLVVGDNILSFVTTDFAENKTSYSPVVIYQTENLLAPEKEVSYNYLILAGGFLVSSILCMSTIIIIKKKESE